MSEGHLSVVKYLVEKGANHRDRNDIALYWACNTSQLEAVEYLLDHDADINSGNGQCLRIARERKYEDLERLLISRGADVDLLED